VQVLIERGSEILDRGVGRSSCWQERVSYTEIDYGAWRSMHLLVRILPKLTRLSYMQQLGMENSQCSTAKLSELLSPLLLT